MNWKKHFNQVCAAVASTTGKLREEAKAVQANGGIPTDYSLGFLNAMIFVDHRLLNRPGEAQFFDRTTSIGKLTKPIALEREQALWLVPEWRARVDGILNRVADALEADWTHSKPSVQELFEDLDKFLTGQDASAAETANTSDVAIPQPPTPKLALAPEGSTNG